MTLLKFRRPAFLLAGLVLAVATARATVTEEFKQTYPLAADGTVHLDNVNGDIDITAWDKAEVSLIAEKRGKTAEDLEKVTLEIESDPAKLSIKTRYAKTGWFHQNVNASVRYRLMVPAGARLQKIDSVNSDITVTGVRGSVNLDTVNGTITAKGLMADARLDSVNGRAEVTLPKGAAAEIHADSVNGRVSVDQAIKLGRIGRHSLTGGVNGGGGPRIVLDTVNGGIAIRER